MEIAAEGREVHGSWGKHDSAMVVRCQRAAPSSYSFGGSAPSRLRTK